MKSAEKTRNIRLRLTRGAEAQIRRGHPWVFSAGIKSQDHPGAAGDLAIIYDRFDRFLAVGLFDPDSPIRVRILRQGRSQPIDHQFFAERWAEATRRRRGLFDRSTEGYRVVNGESDGWPGVVLDRYADTYVLKLYSAAWLVRLTILQDTLIAELNPGRLVLRLSRNIRAAASDLGFSDGQILFGPPITETPTFLESGLRFEADVLRGQKTGFFLDQRENRRRVGELADGRRVLNAFSFSGGFSVYAARGGARSVTDVDISRHALESAESNFALNRNVPNLDACEHRLVQADVFQWIDQSAERRFDLIVLDPPSLARRQSERDGALAAYGRLTSGAIRLLEPGGILMAASCSARVSSEDFFKRVVASARRSGRRFSEMERTGHAPDHPSDIPEAQYLKAIYLRF